MKTLGKLLILTAVLTTCRTLHADIIYSNLGPGGSFSSVNGWTIGYPFKPGEVGQSVAYSFTPSGDFYLSSVDLAVGNRNPTSSSDFTVAIYSDLSGAPDTVLTTASGIAPLGCPPAVTTSVLFSGSTLLSSGSRYWIGLHPAAAEPTDLSWWWNLNADLKSTFWFSNTPSQVLLGGSWENTSTVIECAYQVNGVVVPVPGAVLLGMLGLSVAGVKLRKH